MILLGSCVNEVVWKGAVNEGNWATFDDKVFFCV